MSKCTGFALIDKEEGYTSKDVDSLLKRKFQIKSAGHLGTLDPFATGLLIVGFSDATKFFSLLDESKKTYQATLKLGVETDTLDKTGAVLKEENVPSFTKERVLEVLSSFLGKSMQDTPKYSAVHVDGVRAYDRVRRGEEFTIPKREIEIFEIELLDYNESEILFEATVSKGTYIRQLGYDIATRLGTIGTLTALRRTEIGPYKVEDAKKVSEIQSEDLLRIEQALPYPIVEVEGKDKKRLLAGNPILLDSSSEFVFLSLDGTILALYKREQDNEYRSYKGLSRE